MLETLHILYFETNQLEVKSIKQALKKSHIDNTIITTKNLSEFESLLVSNDFNLILFEPEDLGSEGFRVFKMVREKSPTIPVVILTANGSVESAVNYLKLGAADYLSKSSTNYQRLGHTLLNCAITFQLKQSYPPAIQQVKSFHEVIPDFVFSFRIEPNGSLVKEWSTGIDSGSHIKLSNKSDSLSNWIELVHPQDRQKLDENLRRILAEGKAETLEFRMADNDSNMLRCSLRPIWDEKQNRFIGLLGAGQIITKNRQANERLHELETRYQELVEKIKAVIYVDASDEHSTTLYMSPQVEELSGYSADEWLKDETFWERLIHPQDRERVLAENARTNETGEIFSIDYRIISRDCRVIWLHDEAVPVMDEHGRTLLWQGVLYNITPQKQAEEALKLSEERFRLLAENANDLITLHNINGYILYASPSSLRLTGYSPSELVGLDPYSLVHPDDLRRIKRDVNKQARLGKSIAAFDFRARHKQGTYFWLQSSVRPVLDSNGKITQFVAVYRDVSEYKESEKTLQNTRSQLSQRILELESRTQEISSLAGLSNMLHACIQAEDTYNVVMQFAAGLFPKSSGALIIRDNPDGLIECKTAWGGSQPIVRPFSHHDCWALRRNQPHLASDTRSALLCKHIPDPPPTSTLCVPVLSESQEIGILYLQSDADNPTLSEHELQLAATVAEQVGLALTNLHLRETLREQALRDPLTGLYNRYYMQESFQRELSNADRTGNPVSLIMLDFDYLKEFNDRYGHLNGDEALRIMGQIIRKLFRSSDILCRYGGDEFILVLPETTPEIAGRRAEGLRVHIKETLMSSLKPFRALTISAGVAGWPAHGKTVEDLIRAADIALYQAKIEGRDKVAIYNDFS
jgi:diguanylate cyclase (GGDEF)-like protein/PAS domain S-box-containing protein